LLAAWSIIGQHVANIIAFLKNGFEVADGYRHAMGLRAPFAEELVGVLVLASFIALCFRAALCTNQKRQVAAVILPFSIMAILFWLAFFTRGDDYHWPWFFRAMAFLPVALLCVRYVSPTRTSMTIATVVVTAAVLCSSNESSLAALPREISEKISINLHNLAHLQELQANREADWQRTAASADLPRIRSRIGDARVDMVTWEQGVILLNGLNYAP